MHFEPEFPDWLSKNLKNVINDWVRLGIPNNALWDVIYPIKFMSN